MITEQQIETVLPPALSLVWAVREMEPAGVEECFCEVEALVDDPLSAARAMAVVLAAMVPDDAAANRLLAWLADPAEYRKLRAADIDAGTAAAAVSAGRKKRD